ncbi:MAG: hypothetical protein Tsb009_15220 [Planctomycetaceae bacterium]
MIRSRLACFKHMTYAVLVLGLVIVVLEIGMRWRSGSSGTSMGEADSSSQLLTKCWLVHHRMKPLQSIEAQNPDTGETVKLSTNSFGLRGSEIAIPKPANVFRILCLGDESTLAMEVPKSQTFCAQLESQLAGKTSRRVEVINGGVPGYSPLLSYLLLKHSLLSLQPDLVVLNFDMTDVADDHRYRRYTQIDQSGRPLACRHPDVNGEKVAKRKKRDRFLLVTWARHKLGRMSTDADHQLDGNDIDSSTGRYAWLKDRPPNWSLYLRQCFSVIADLDRLTHKVGARFMVVACPAPWQVSAKATNSPAVRERVGVPLNVVYKNPAPLNGLQTFLEQRGISFLNPVESFRQVPNSDRLFFQNAPRFSAAGHELYAREISQAVLPLLRAGRSAAFSSGSGH